MSIRHKNFAQFEILVTTHAAMLAEKEAFTGTILTDKS